MTKLKAFLASKKGVISLYGVVVALIACIMLAGYLDLTQTTQVVEEVQSIMDITALSTLQGSLDAEGVRFDRLTIRGYKYFQGSPSPAEQQSINSETDKDELLAILRADGNDLANTTIWLDGTNADNVDQTVVRNIILENYNYYLSKILFNGSGEEVTPLFNYNDLNVNVTNPYNTASIIKKYEIREFDAGLMYKNWGVDAENKDGDYQKIPQAYIDTTLILYLEVEPTFSSINIGVEESHLYNALTSANSTSKLHVEGYTDDGLLVVSIRTLSRMTVQGFIASDETPDITEIEFPADQVKEADESYFNMTDDGIITGFSATYYALDINDRPKNIKIPATIRGISPVKIASYAFKPEDNLTAIVISASITEIEDNAFYGLTSLKNVGFTSDSQLTTIGEKAFYGCSKLRSFNLPKGVSTIPTSAFENCSNLSSFKFHTSVTSIGDNAFKNCSQLKGKLNLPANVNTIGNQAFFGCSSITSINIPRLLQNLGTAAFAQQASLTKFESNNIYDFKVVDDVLYERDGSEWTLIQYPANKQNINYTIPCISGNLVTKIADYAFYGNEYLQTLLYTTNGPAEDKSVLHGIQVVGDYAFEKCSALIQLKFADNKTDVSGNIIRMGLTSIGTNAFSRTNRLSLIYIDKVQDSVAGSPWGANTGWTTIKWSASDETDWSMIYSWTDTGVIMGLTGYGANMVETGVLPTISIPEKINGVKITSIGDNAFSCISGQSTYYQANDCIYSIILPSSITSIGKNAFRGTEITKIVLPENVQVIGDYAFADSNLSEYIISGNKPLKYGNGVFANSKLQSFVLPINVTSIGHSLFKDCSSLRTIQLEATITSIPNSMFQNCNQLSNIEIPTSVTDIGNNAFDGCNMLNSINSRGSTLLSVTNVGDKAFQGCVSLMNIYFGSIIKNIGDETFNNANYLNTIYLDVDEDSVEGAPWGAKSSTNIAWKNSTWVKYYTYTASGTTWKITGLSEVGRKALTDGTLTELKTPLVRDNKPISSLAFTDADRYALNKLQIMTIQVSSDISTYTIADNAFKNATALKTIVLDDGISSIGDNAFQNCTSLLYVAIPDSCKSVGNNAFENCSNLEAVSIGNGLTAISNSMFQNCSKLTSYNCASDITSIGQYAFAGTALTTWTIERNISTIGDYAFQGCSQLTTIINDNNNKLSAISTGVFKDCTKLESITLPYSIAELAVGAFENCSALKAVTIPNNVKRIEKNAFRGCTSLNTVTFKTDSKLESIGETAFKNCLSLSSLTLGSKVTTIASDALSTTSLTHITIRRPTNSIANAPWGATNATIQWTG